MQTVPSLVGTGTAIAAAASGLVFGQPTDQDHKLDNSISTPSRPGARGHKRTVSVDRVLPAHPAASPTGILTLPSRRPATSIAASRSIGIEIRAVADSFHQKSRPPLSRRQRPQYIQVSPSNTSSRRPSFVGDQGNLAPDPEELKDSLTSTNSWLRRLSIRPLSQHGSPRSSILADSTTITASHGSTAPILSRSGSISKPLTPNKLVKRSSSKHNHVEDPSTCKSRGHLPSLRRPATSHQRSADLQQLRADIDVAGSRTHPKYSFDEPIRPEELLGASPIEGSDKSPRTHSVARKSSWVSFFHSKLSEFGIKPNSQERVSSGGGDAASGIKSLRSKRRNSGKGSSRSSGAHLIKPRMVSNTSTASGSLASTFIYEEDVDRTAKRQKDGMDSPLRADMASEVALSAQPRKSFSSSFSHTAHWALKTSGSLRRSKRGANQGDSDTKRHVSAPVRGLPLAVGRFDSTTKAPIALKSSPLPLIPNLSGVHADSSRPMRTAPGGASRSPRPSQPSGSSTSSASAAMSQRRGSHYDKLSALDSSDGDARDLNSADEDDTDFKSDTLFDSLRTIGSGRARVVETSLESLYDESPPSTGGNKKSKRLSIQEILDRTWSEDSRIMEEDETTATPVRAAPRPVFAKQERKHDPRFSLKSSPHGGQHIGGQHMTNKIGRLSVDDDFDEDWTRDEDEAPFNALSPPSKNNSLNSSSSINPNVRLALASIGGNMSPVSSKIGSPRIERSLGNLFDWSEPPVHDKQNPIGGAHRPKTAYGKQQVDSRGGRSVVRKGPMPTHVRSQSVPVVHEGAEDAKPTGSKYGTWGLGTKTVSEDWDEDFEFGGDNVGPDGKESQDLFAVPESIRASQPSVKAHSGQIRELSLLVNDLKRLCRHGREMDMLSGDQKPFWKEAEGIIALASPDEDNGNDDGPSGSSIYMDAFEANGSPVDEQYMDLPFEMLDAVMERSEPPMSRTAVVRERQSPRRRSVFSPDDEIFGTNWPLTDERPRSTRPSRPRTPENLPNKAQNVNVVVRSVMETVQNRSNISALEPVTQEARKGYNANNRMHFDTNSLKALVKRAGELRDVLSDMIRKADQLTQSPIRTPRHEKRLDSSPAFTRVFDDPGSSPPRWPTKTRSSSSTLVERPSPENSPPSNLGRRVPLMTVN